MSTNLEELVCRIAAEQPNTELAHEGTDILVQFATRLIEELGTLKAAAPPVLKPNELAARRVEQTGDCRHWTPKDALLACLRDLEEGKIAPEMLVIHFRQPYEEDPTCKSYNYYVAGCTRIEHAGLLAMAQAKITDPSW